MKYAYELSEMNIVFFLLKEIQRKVFQGSRRNIKRLFIEFIFVGKAFLYTCSL
jgi:hypothetical protein